MAHALLEELVQLMRLEQVEENLFRGQSQDPGWGALYGGHVLGQALSAAAQTVPAQRHVHSLHAYFLRSGDVSRPVLYDVDRIRDGASFTTRRVVATQRGEAIFHMAASFHVGEHGVEHQDTMPAVPPPESLQTEQDLARPHAHQVSEPYRSVLLAERPFEVRPVFPIDGALHATAHPPERGMWIRAMGPVPDDAAIHRALLAYLSDHSLISTSLLPHAMNWLTPGMHVASLDHVMWFHRPFRTDEWLYYAMQSPSACGARALVRGRIFSRDGQLVASVMQEGLVRLRSAS